jgi:hypothetical protein
VTIEYRNAEGLAEPPGYTHVAVARGTHTATPPVPSPSTPRAIWSARTISSPRRSTSSRTCSSSSRRAAPAPLDVVKTSVYMVGSDAAMNTVWEVVQASPIASAPSTLLGVSPLGYAGQLVEIEAIAVCDAP